MQLLWEATVPRKAVSLNQAFATDFKTGRRFMSKTGKEFKQFISQYAQYMYRSNPSTLPLLEHLTFTFTNKIRRDVDNFPKLINDSLTGIIFKDDSQIQELHIKKEYGPSNEIKIKIYTYT